MRFSFPAVLGKRGIAGMIRAISYARRQPHSDFGHLSGNAAAASNLRATSAA